MALVVGLLAGAACDGEWQPLHAGVARPTMCRTEIGVLADDRARLLAQARERGRTRGELRAVRPDEGEGEYDPADDRTRERAPDVGAEPAATTSYQTPSDAPDGARAHGGRAHADPLPDAAAGPASVADVEANADADSDAARRADARTCIDVRSADARTLERLPRVGPRRAQDIVTARERKPFARTRDLLRVRGIGPATLRVLKPKLCPFD